MKLLSLVSTLFAVAALGACTASEPTEDDGAGADGALSSDAPVKLLDQWSAEQRAGFYRTSEGSQLLPYRWFLALEEAARERPFRSDQNMTLLGYIPEAKSASNPDGLPVGFARDEDPTTGAWLGLTCAACHTSQISYRGTNVRIDGGPSLGDMTMFLSSIYSALRATLNDEAKFARFAEKVVGPDAPAREVDDLWRSVTEEKDRLAARIERNRPEESPGRGHIDPVANIFNEIICGATNMPQNCVVPRAPLKMPHLWGTADLEWVQANSLAHNPLPRNISQSMGVFARTTVQEDCSLKVDAMNVLAQKALCAFKSTVRIRNMSHLQQYLAQLQPPRWPADVLGPIDTAKAARGRELYATECASCHSSAPYPRTPMNGYGRSFVPVTMIPLEQIGTDPTMARAIVDRRADPGPFRSAFEPADFDADGKVQALKLVGYAVGGTLLNAFGEELGITDILRVPEYFDFRGFGPPPSTTQLLSYKARPLAGIAFAGYLLHNGSVPNVYELLLPSAQRSKVFHVGSRDYDPVRLGFVSDVPTPGSTVFDTQRPGQSNAGHEYGAGLTDPDRWSLVEYLKTL